VNCEIRFPDEVLERYLRGELAETDRAALEDHYFECASCLERVELMQALPEALARGRRIPAIPARPRRFRTAFAALSTLATAAVLWVTIGPRPAASPAPPTSRPTPTPPADPLASLRALGRFDPPPYQPTPLRGGESLAADLADAMGHYRSEDYASAIAGLTTVVRRSPREPTARFFLGICYLLTDRPDEGVAELRRTIALGDTPYLEEARLYVARAHLQAGRIDDARNELSRVIDLRGDHEAAARELVREIERVVRR
jgi:tetratricopeptide (TPR) repeat protein